MNDKFPKNFGTVLAVVAVVCGWVLLSNLPHHSEGTYNRLSGVDYTDWEPWVGIILLSVGISFFVLKLLPSDSNRT